MKLISNFFKLVLIAIVTIFYALSVIIVMKINGKGRFYAYARKWSGILLKIAGVKVKPDGLDGIYRENGNIFVSNHASNFDIPILLSTLPCDVIIMYKLELEKIPLFGLCLRLSPFIAVDRDNPRSAMKSIDEARRLVQNGGSIIIFPEGTRSVDGTLGEFKRGAFSIASGSGANLTPISISGTFGIMKRGTYLINPGVCRLTIHKPVKMPGTLNKIAETGLSAEIKEIIASAL